jgi:hypothetical protein
MYNLGSLYDEEKKDFPNAEKYYQMAADKGDIEAMNNLGCLYEEKKKDFPNAEKYYQMAADKGDAIALGNLANLYFEINSKSKKSNALELSYKALEIANNEDIELNFIHVGILLWNEKIKEAILLMTDMLNGPLHNEENILNFSEALQYFLVFRQKHFLYNLFASNSEWIDKYKPIYYALLHEMQDEHLKEYLKMTEELEEPVKAILEFVYKEQKRLEV